MIVLNNVSKRFGPVRALDSISFSAKKGEVIGFLGKNGAGKTTTMRLIVGYLVPTSGTVKVGGDIDIRTRVDLSRHAGYLPENNPLYGDMKVSEYLGFVAEVKGDRDCHRIASLVDLQSVWDRRIDTLSRGYKQRVGLGAALLGDPEILILDEPTSGLDPVEQEKIKTLITKLSKKKTVIFSTHILSEVEDVATRLIIINNGVIAYDGKKPKGKGAVEALFKKTVKS